MAEDIVTKENLKEIFDQYVVQYHAFRFEGVGYFNEIAHAVMIETSGLDASIMNFLFIPKELLKAAIQHIETLESKLTLTEGILDRGKREQISVLETVQRQVTEFEADQTTNGLDAQKRNYSLLYECALRP